MCFPACSTISLRHSQHPDLPVSNVPVEGFVAVMSVSVAIKYQGLACVGPYWLASVWRHSILEGFIPCATHWLGCTLHGILQIFRYSGL